jgi:hypothetical protein
MEKFVVSLAVEGRKDFTDHGTFRTFKRSSVIQGLVNKALRTGEQMACYENPEVPSPFQTLRYDKPIKSRATFTGFYQGPTEERPSPRVVCLDYLLGH